MYRALSGLTLLLMLAGCMTFIVEGDVPKTPDSTTGGETVHGSLYDFTWQRRSAEKCTDRKGLARVEYHTNPLYLMSSVATLGLYVPQRVTWWCDGGKPADHEDEDLYIPTDE